MIEFVVPGFDALDEVDGIDVVTEAIDKSMDDASVDVCVRLNSAWPSIIA